MLRWPIAFVAILLFFALVYYLAPNTDAASWKWVSPGSLVGALMWLALSGLFALYTSFSGSYETYGSLAGAIILLLWLNYSAFALLFGAELNAELDRQADIRAAGGAGRGPDQAGGALSSYLSVPLTRRAGVATGVVAVRAAAGLTAQVTVPRDASPSSG